MPGDLVGRAMFFGFVFGFLRISWIIIASIFLYHIAVETGQFQVMKESIEEAGRGTAHELERFLTTLGTIATLAPLMGLFGTVVGMIEIFGSQSGSGANPVQLAHGISVALYNTGFGLAIAMPALVFYRHFRALVDGFIVDMEQQAVKFVDTVHSSRK